MGERMICNDFPRAKRRFKRIEPFRAIPPQAACVVLCRGSGPLGGWRVHSSRVLVSAFRENELQ